MRPRLREKIGLPVLLAPLWFGLGLATFWPGILTYDAYHALSDWSRGAPFSETIYETALYSFLNYLFYQLDPRLSYGVLCQILLATFTIAYAYRVGNRLHPEHRLGSYWAWGLLLLPMNPMMLAFAERDVPYAWLLTLLCLQWWDWQGRDVSVSGRQSRAKILGLCLTAVLLASLRREGLLLLFLVPLQFCWLGGKKNWRTLAAAWVFLSLLFLVVLPWSLHSPKVQYETLDNYNLSAVLQPVAYILRERGGPLSTEEETRMRSAYDWDAFQKWNVGDYFDDRHFNYRISREDAEKFAWFAARTIASHPSLFLKQRVSIFRKSLSREMVGDYAPSLFPATEQIPEYVRFERDHGLSPDPVWPGLKSLWMRAYDYLHSRSPLFFLFCSPLVGIVALSLFLAIQAKRTSLVVAAGPILNLLVIFCLQPTGEPKYLYFLYLLSPVFLARLLLVSLPNRRGGALRSSRPSRDPGGST